ncbi:MAG: hypothetical protein J6S54_01930 [Lentisphaeria bacterium]|nr:hypothetical protein [Lentisphaeria bacterium]
MKTTCRIMFLMGILFSLAGCSSVLLQGGKYTGRDRGEFAMVYEDLIFLRVKAGKNIPGSLTYWEWGGKYTVDSNTRRLKLDMERETGKLWKFSYNIYAERNAVVLEDLTENKRFYLNYEYPALRRKPANAPKPFSSPGVDPVYQQLAPIE